VIVPETTSVQTGEPDVDDCDQCATATAGTSE
jgi:hypothetical protein